MNDPVMTGCRKSESESLQESAGNRPLLPQLWFLTGAASWSAFNGFDAGVWDRAWPRACRDQALEEMTQVDPRKKRSVGGPNLSNTTRPALPGSVMSNTTNAAGVLSATSRVNPKDPLMVSGNLKDEKTSLYYYHAKHAEKLAQNQKVEKILPPH